MAQMFEPYLYKSVDNFDLSMGMSATGQENGDGYMAVDQTFHTPSFGDEEFDIPPINLPPTSGSETVSSDMYGSQPLNHQQGQHVSQQQQQQQQQPPCSQSMSMGMGDPGVMTSVASTPSPSMNVMDSGPHQYTGPPLHPPSHHDMYMVQIGAGSMLPPQSVHFQVQQYNVPTSYANAPMQQQHMEHQVPPHHMGVLPPHHHAHHPQQQHQQLLPPSSMLGLQLGPPRQQRPGSVGSSPPGSNQTSPGLETSEDSDDSGHLSQLMGGIKRPSPEPADRPPSGGKPKKPKVQKKKKKRDPNEPQKPVSAYALFFRDTQAAIKGQNPNASFGEVSKIVASMWDGLDIEHKNVYKKKTEAAKKEYLKALAAYRASLVSKAANDQSESLYGSNPGVSTTTSMSTTSSVPSHSLSPLQKKSPLLTSLMEGTNVNSLQTMTQPQPLLVGQPQMGGGNGLVHHPHMVPQHVSHSGQQMLHHLPPGQMVHAMAIRQPVSQMMGMPNHNHQGQPGGQQVINNNHSYSPNMMSSSPQMSHPGQGVSQSMMGPSPLQNCLRNPGTEPQEWDREYCNNDCVVSHCRDVFTTWVSSRPPPNSYASVK